METDAIDILLFSPALVTGLLPGAEFGRAGGGQQAGDEQQAPHGGELEHQICCNIK